LTESTGEKSEIAIFLEQLDYVLAKDFPVNQLFLQQEIYQKCVANGIFEPKN